MTGHQHVVVTTPSLGGKEIARYATDLANERGIGRRGQDDGLLLLVAPNERPARIAVGRGLETRLPVAAAQEYGRDTRRDRVRADVYVPWVAVETKTTITRDQITEAIRPRTYKRPS